MITTTTHSPSKPLLASESAALRPGEFKFFTLIACLMVSMLLLSNVLSAAKLISVPFIPWLRLSGSAPVYSLVFLGSDVLTEIYGYSRTRRVIWMGFAVYLSSAILIWLVGVWPPAPEWDFQGEYDRIFGTLPRLHAAAFLSYLSGEFVNSYVVAKAKIRLHKSHMAFRFLFSTFVGQFVDSIIFFPLAFGGMLDAQTVFRLVVSSWLFKTAWEAMLLPVTVPLVNWLKKVENSDVLDIGTNFQPFHLS